MFWLSLIISQPRREGEWVIYRKFDFKQLEILMNNNKHKRNMTLFPKETRPNGDCKQFHLEKVTLKSNTVISSNIFIYGAWWRTKFQQINIKDKFDPLFDVWQRTRSVSFHMHFWMDIWSMQLQLWFYYTVAISIGVCTVKYR